MAGIDGDGVVAKPYLTLRLADVTFFAVRWLGKRAITASFSVHPGDDAEGEPVPIEVQNPATWIPGTVGGKTFIRFAQHAHIKVGEHSHVTIRVMSQLRTPEPVEAACFRVSVRKLSQAMLTHGNVRSKHLLEAAHFADCSGATLSFVARILPSTGDEEGDSSDASDDADAVRFRALGAARCAHGARVSADVSSKAAQSARIANGDDANAQCRRVHASAPDVAAAAAAVALPPSAEPRAVLEAMQELFGAYLSQAPIMAMVPAALLPANAGNVGKGGRKRGKGGKGAKRGKQGQAVAPATDAIVFDAVPLTKAAIKAGVIKEYIGDFTLASKAGLDGGAAGGAEEAAAAGAGAGACAAPAPAAPSDKKRARKPAVPGAGKPARKPAAMDAAKPASRRRKSRRVAAAAAGAAAAW